MLRVEVQRVVEVPDRVHGQVVFGLDLGAAGRRRVLRQGAADAAGLGAQAGVQALELVLAVPDVLGAAVGHGVLEPLDGGGGI